jgi:hypothetical protein
MELNQEDIDRILSRPPPTQEEIEDLCQQARQFRQRAEDKKRQEIRKVLGIAIAVALSSIMWWLLLQ